MIARLLRALEMRRSAARAARRAQLETDLDRLLADRRRGREQRNERSRRSAATRVHRAFAEDRLRNSMMRF